MTVHYIKGLGMIAETEENKQLLIDKGILKEPKKELKTAKVVVYDTNEQRTEQQDSSDVKRAIKRKSAK